MMEYYLEADFGLVLKTGKKEGSAGLGRTLSSIT